MCNKKIKKLFFIIFFLLFSIMISCNEKNEPQKCTPVCTDTQNCDNGTCVDKPKKCNPTCSDTQKCEDGTCIDKPKECNPTCSDTQNCKNGTCVDKATLMVIKKIQTDSSLIGEEVMTKGIVSAIALSQKVNHKGLYIQDSLDKHSGIYIYFTTAGKTEFKVGDQVEVHGILDRELNYARIRTKIEDIVVLSHDEKVYDKLEVDYFSEDIKDYESMLVNVKLESRFNLSEYLDRHIVFSNDKRDKILIKDTISWLNHLSINVKLVKLIGVIDNSKDGVRVLPRAENEIQISTPHCDPTCKEWESCLDDNLCVLDIGRCEKKSDCKANYDCDLTDNYCKVSNIILDNGDFDIWSEDKPTGYIYGKAIKVHQEDKKKYRTDYGAIVIRDDGKVDATKDMHILSPKIAVNYNKNYKLTLFVLDNDYNVDCRIYYEAYDINDNKIGSMFINGNNGLTKNVENWIELTTITNFLGGEIWRGTPDNLSYIRFGIRVHKGHDQLNNGEPIDNTIPPGYPVSGNGKIYLDSLSIEEVTQ